MVEIGKYGVIVPDAKSNDHSHAVESTGVQCHVHVAIFSCNLSIISRVQEASVQCHDIVQ